MILFIVLFYNYVYNSTKINAENLILKFKRFSVERRG